MAQSSTSIEFLAGDAVMAAFGEPFLAIPRWIEVDKSLTPEMRYLYGVLVNYVRLSMQNDRPMTPGRVRLADDCNASPESVSRWLKHLRSRGWVAWKRRGPNQTAIYTVYGPCTGTDGGSGSESCQNDSSRNRKMTTKEERSFSPDVENEEESVPVSIPKRATARKSKISPAWRPTKNLAAHVLDRTGWTQARLDAEILKFIGWHESHDTRHSDWNAAFSRTWVTKAQEFEKRDEGRAESSERNPRGTVL